MEDKYIESSTEEGVFYKITEEKKLKCTCKGFKFKGTCKHVENLVIENIDETVE